MKKLEIIKIIKEEIAGVLSEEEARPFTIKYKVEGSEGEGYKFVATVVDKSGNKEFESFEEPLASPNAPRDAAYQKVTQKARDFMRQSAKDRAAPAPKDTPVKKVTPKDDKSKPPVKKVTPKDDKLKPKPKPKPEPGPKPKGIIEQIPRGDFLGKSFPVIIAEKNYIVKFENVKAESSVTNPFSLGVDGQMTLTLPNKQTRSFKLKDTQFIPSFRYMIRKQDSKEPALRVGLMAAGGKKVNGILDEATIKILFKEALSISKPGAEKEISMKTEDGKTTTAQLMRRK